MLEIQSKGAKALSVAETAAQLPEAFGKQSLKPDVSRNQCARIRVQILAKVHSVLRHPIRIQAFGTQPAL